MPADGCGATTLIPELRFCRNIFGIKEKWMNAD
jgi:hypothetical protein